MIELLEYDENFQYESNIQELYEKSNEIIKELNEIKNLIEPTS